MLKSSALGRGLEEPRPKARIMRWGAWTGRGSGAKGGKQRKAGEVATSGGSGGWSFVFFRGGRGEETGAGRQRSTKQRFRLSVSAPMADEEDLRLGLKPKDLDPLTS